MTTHRLSLIAALACGMAFAAPLSAQDLREGGKLILTNGITSIDGATGGGLTPWATIAGNETRDGIGAQASVTQVELEDYDFRTIGVAVGIFDRVELSYTRQLFDTNKIGGALGLGNDYHFRQDIFGAKVKLFGDLVYGPSMLPVVAVGAEYKRSLNAPVVAFLGASHDKGVDLYATATKLFLNQSVLVDTTFRLTKANQNGLLGFGSADTNRYTLHPEATIAYQFSRHFAVGAEFRSKRDSLAVAREDDWYDVFAAYAIGRNLTVTAAYTDLGSIATIKGQRGALLQLQGSF